MINPETRKMYDDLLERIDRIESAITSSGELRPFSRYVYSFSHQRRFYYS